MCRAEAQSVWSRAAEFQAAGAARLVCVVKEDIDNQVEEFREFWGGDVYHDEYADFYKALGGGKEHRPHSLSSFLAAMMNPFSRDPMKENVKKFSGTKGNLTGEGFIAGGCYVIRTDGKAQYAFLEQNMGDHAPVDEVIAAVAMAAAS